LQGAIPQKGAKTPVSKKAKKQLQKIAKNTTGWNTTHKARAIRKGNP
jgi:hypothetical protein